jgi:hypothetical protein
LADANQRNISYLSVVTDRSAFGISNA